MGWDCLSFPALAAVKPRRGLSAPSSFPYRLRAALLWTGVAQDIVLPVQAGDKHGPAVLFAAWLVAGNDRLQVSSRGCVAQGFAEATLAELIGTAEEFDRIVDVERGKQEFHCSIVLVAQRQDVRPHGAILASATKQNPRTEPRVFGSSPWRTGDWNARLPWFSCCRPGASRWGGRRLSSSSHPCRYQSWMKRAAGWACCRPCYRAACAGFRERPNVP
jgi:hypothetical protein